MNTKKFALTAMIAAVYTVVSLALAPISFGNIQIRIAEALTLLPLIFYPSIWGVTLGCFLTNILGAILGLNPLGLIDAVVGTLATFLAANCTYQLREYKVKGIPLYSILMPVIFNAVFVGIELGVLFFPQSVMMGSIICGIEVGIGEFISVILGWFFIQALQKTKLFAE